CVTPIMVVRSGDGSAALTTASTAAFVEEHLPSGVALNTIALPIAASGSNAACTSSGSSTAEGGLSRSADTHFVTLGCYGVAPGTAAVSGTTSAAVNRIVARVDTSRAADTSTHLSAAYSGANIRSATSNDGTAFWASGS